MIHRHYPDSLAQQKVSNMTTSYRRTLILSIAITGLLTTSGCSNFSKAFGYKDSVAQDDNYRVTQDALVNPLELPPGFQNPSRNMDASNRLLIGQLNDKLKTDIPSFKVAGMRVDSNLSERWLHIDKADANDVWERLQKFLNTQGFAIEEARKDIGLIKTQFLARKEIVPKTEMGFLTRVLNSWRAEMAQGALDRLTLRLQSDAQGGLDVFFRHNMIVEIGDGGAGNWRSRPYHPEFEAETLYQALVFLGASKDAAQLQLASAVKTMESSLNGEFYGLTFSAGLEETWQHLLSRADRANFSILQADKANGVMQIKLPNSTQTEKGFFARLFSGEPPRLPETIKLSVKTEQGKTDVIIPSGTEEATLTAAQRKEIFQHLGLLP
jgi:outer membrane protein assembly factor BamC